MRFPEFSGEWKEVKIGNITTKVGSGVTPKGGSSVYTNSGHIFIRSQNVDNGAFLLKDVAYIDDATHQKQKSTELVCGDVLLNITGASIGRSAVVNSSVAGGNVNQHVCIIRVIDSILPNFLCNYLLSYRGQKQIDSFQAGGNREGLNFEQIKSIKLKIPSTSEQNKITSLLSKLDERIAAQKKVIEKLQSLIGGIYKSIFADIDCSFRLDEICEIRKGQQVNGTELFEDGEYYVMNGGVEPSGCYDKFNTPANTISISEGGNSCGYVQFNNRPFWSGGHCYTLRNVNLQYNLRFLYHYLKANESEIMKLRIGSGLPNIQKKDLASYCVPAIEMKEQIKIAQLLNSIQSRIDISCKLLDSYERQKTYLLSTMFI